MSCRHNARPQVVLSGTKEVRSCLPYKLDFLFSRSWFGNFVLLNLVTLTCSEAWVHVVEMSTSPPLTSTEPHSDLLASWLDTAYGGLPPFPPPKRELRAPAHPHSVQTTIWPIMGKASEGPTAEGWAMCLWGMDGSSGSRFRC